MEYIMKLRHSFWQLQLVQVSSYTVGYSASDVLVV